MTTTRHTLLLTMALSLFIFWGVGQSENAVDSDRTSDVAIAAKASVLHFSTSTLN